MALLTVSVEFADHVPQLSFARVLSKVPHHSPEFLCGYLPVLIAVKQVERFPKFCNNYLFKY
jgi:hypothetical protein